MKTSQKMGGISALIMAATFLVGLVLSVTLLANYTSGDMEPLQEVAFIANNQILLYVENMIIFVLFGIFLVVLALALYNRLKAGSPGMIQTATAFGLIWAGLAIASGMLFNIGSSTVADLYANDPAQAVSFWTAIYAVYNGLGGGNEIAGGLWILLVSWAALRAEGLSRILNYFGIVVGVAGLLTVIPGLDVLGYVFGIGSIVWFVWLGFMLLRDNRSTAA
jgi:hypothetical protein